MTSALAQTDFEPLVGSTFMISNGSDTVPLELDIVSPLPESGRQGGSFRLEFRGPIVPVLPQSIYEFEIRGEAEGIFIVPIGPKVGEMRYEAIFF